MALLLTWACARMAGIAILPMALKPVRNLPASTHLDMDVAEDSLSTQGM